MTMEDPKSDSVTGETQFTPTTSTDAPSSEEEKPKEKNHCMTASFVILLKLASIQFHCMKQSNH